VHAATVVQKLMAQVLHRYPFVSGCGTLANSKLARALVPPSSRIVYGKVDRFDCAVPLDDLVGRTIFLVGDLDPKVSWVTRRCVRPGDTTLDIGANLGVITLQLAAQVGPAGKVLSFEPAPFVGACLAHDIARNGLDHVTLFPYALGREAGTLALAVPAGNAGKATLVPEIATAGAVSHEVEIRVLAKVLAEEKVDRIKLMKVDVEGFEENVFQGLFDDLAAPRPEVIVFEENDAPRSTTFDLLRQNQYEIFGLPKRLMRVVALPEDHDAFLRAHDYVAVHEFASPHVRKSLNLPNS
jgi:FkbM family methyltransferase